MGQSETECAVLVLSCDKYRDLWDSALTLLDRYWSDCPFAISIGSERVPGGRGRVRSVLSGAAVAWSDVTRAIVTQIRAEYILLILDDFFITAPVSTARVLECLEWMRGSGAAYLRLVPSPPPTKLIDVASEIGEHEKGAPYRASLQAAIWRRSALLSLLVADESPWDFETAASRRSEQLQAPFLCVTRAALPYVDVLERGKWLPRGVALCKREGLQLDSGARSSVSARDHVRRGMTRVASRVVGLVPWRVRMRLRSWRQRDTRAK